MFALLDRAAPVSRTSWMRAEPPPTPPGRHVALVPGVLIFHPAAWQPAALLDTHGSLPLAEEPVPVPRVFPFPDWHEWALCNGEDENLFFSEDRKQRVQLTAEARRICKACPAAEECLVWALTHDEQFGIWSGTSGRQRAGMQERILQGSSVQVEVDTWFGR